MTRASIQQAIDFRGLIEGCSDHQWLLTDALYHSGAEPPPDDTARWVIQSDLLERPPSSDREAKTIQDHFVAHDREAGWTLSAPSAAGLAERIRQQYAESPPPCSA